MAVGGTSGQCVGQRKSEARSGSPLPNHAEAIRRWWELFTRRRGVLALRTVDRFDPGEEELFLDYLVYLFVGQGLAAATAQARLGAIRSVHLQLGFPDPLKPLPRLLLALEGIRRRRGPVTKRRPVTPRMLARANSALPSDLWGRGLSCALQLGFFFLLRVSEIVGGSNPRLGLRAKDVALFHKGRQVHHPYFDQADEVQVVVRASKTDPEGETATRNLYRSGAEVCPVLSTARYLSLLWQQSGEPSQLVGHCLGGPVWQHWENFLGRLLTGGDLSFGGGVS